MPSSIDALRVELVEDDAQRRLGHLAAALERVVAVHQHLGLDDRHQACFLAQRRVARQRVRVRLDAAPARSRAADGDDGAPLREARAHAGVVGEPLAQAVEAFGDDLVGEAGERPSRRRRP